MTLDGHITFADLAPVANHLWQSTLCVGVVWLATLALRENRAAVRYWLWFAASVKFLIPFSLLVSTGSRLAWRPAPAVVQPQWTFVMDNVASPFAGSIPAVQGMAPHGSLPIPAILIGVWLCGFAAGIVFWVRGLHKMRAVRRLATPLALGLAIPARSSPLRIEPGVFGILRPVLLLPEGIADRLAPPQRDAILAHEMCHVRRRDNLTAAIHMLVETVFWFHPLLWWIRTRLIEERERACDEEVIRLGADPETYAEGIIAVCKSYIESPVACVSGISGSDLKKRIVHIVTRGLGDNLSFHRKLLLGVMGIVALAGPVAFGFLNAPLLHAQSSTADWHMVAGTKMAFEVASVKPSKAGSRGNRENLEQPGSYVNTTNFTLEYLIEKAYFPYHPAGSPNALFELSGTTGWMNSEHFDIEAKSEGNPTVEQKQLMLQSLLADRFKLVVHRETRQLPVYALVLAKAGKIGPQLIPHVDDADCVDPSAPALPPSDTAGAPLSLCGAFLVHVGGGGLSPEARNVTMSWFADNLSGLVGRLVVDRTGLSGTFDLTLRYTPDVGQPGSHPRPDGTASDPSAPPSIFTALQEQLGLKIESQTGPVDVLVVDHAEEPSGN